MTGLLRACAIDVFAVADHPSNDVFEIEAWLATALLENLEIRRILGERVLHRFVDNIGDRNVHGGRFQAQSAVSVGIEVDRGTLCG